MKVLSIIVPVYNTEKYLRRCLDSILVNEALPYFEAILVNDGSKDHSADIIREYQQMFPDNIVFIIKRIKARDTFSDHLIFLLVLHSTPPCLFALSYIIFDSFARLGGASSRIYNTKRRDSCVYPESHV